MGADSVTQIPCAVNLKAVVPVKNTAPWPHESESYKIFKLKQVLLQKECMIQDLLSEVQFQHTLLEELRKELDEYRQYCGG